MGEAGVRHSHPDRGVHVHATTLAPEVIDLLQQLEDFAASLRPDAAVALRRLLRAGLVAEDQARAESAGQSGGYQHDWYRAFIATRHDHPPAAILADPFVYLPHWWSLTVTRRRTPPPARREPR